MTDMESTPPNKLTNDITKLMNEHIDSYHPPVSHYRCKHAPLRRPELTVWDMYKNFHEKNPSVTIVHTTYKHVGYKQNPVNCTVRVWSRSKSSHFNGKELHLQAPAIKAQSSYKHGDMRSRQLLYLHIYAQRVGETRIRGMTDKQINTSTLQLQQRTHVHPASHRHLARPPVPTSAGPCVWLTGVT